MWRQIHPAFLYFSHILFFTFLMDCSGLLRFSAFHYITLNQHALSLGRKDSSVGVNATKKCSHLEDYLRASDKITADQKNP